MKLFRTKSNASTPTSGKPNRLSRLLNSNRSKADVGNTQDSSATQPAQSFDIPANPFPSPKSSSPREPDLPPHLPPVSDAVGNGSFIETSCDELPSSQINVDNSIVYERDMARKLMDVESSFVPEDKSVEKTESYFVSEPTRWPRTRTVSPDRNSKPQTYLNYGPGKVHHRTVTHNALDEDLSSISKHEIKSRITPDFKPESQDVARPDSRPISQISTNRDELSGVQSGVRDLSFYTAASNPRSDLYSTTTRGNQPERLYFSNANRHELALDDSSVDTNFNSYLPSSPITAAASRRVERVTAAAESDNINSRGNDHNETTPKQARHRPQNASSQLDTRLPKYNGPRLNSIDSLSPQSLSPPPTSAIIHRHYINRKYTPVLSTTDPLEHLTSRNMRTDQYSTHSISLSDHPQDSQPQGHPQQANGRADGSPLTYAEPSKQIPSPPNQRKGQYPTSPEPSPTDTLLRPSGMQSRQISQSSTVSFAQSIDMLDDADNGADYALQTGGATSVESSMIHLDQDLRRPPSLGSLASLTFHRSPRRGLSSNSRHSSTQHIDVITENHVFSSGLETPRAVSHTAADPTDTVLAQHVRDVFVPETVAREYRANHAILDHNESRAILSTPKLGHGSSSLTLKEQNSKIDKLSKENFDLKLKIHFLHEALQDRSDEGVKDLVSKNAYLQAELVNMKKDNQSLRRRLRQFEREQQEQASISSAALSLQYESEEERSAQAARYEDEIDHFRDRAQNLELDNVKLVQIWQGLLNEETTKTKSHEQEIFQLRQENLQLKNLQNCQLPEDQQGQHVQQELLKLKVSSSTVIQELQQEILRLKDNRSPLWKVKLRQSRSLLRREGTSDTIQSRTSESTQDRQEGESLSGTTVVEQLKNENAELRRDLGAQTSMLTSRNRERERLQQEIQDLKLLQRQGNSTGSTAGDSIMDRSVSRNHLRPGSQASGYSHLSEVDRDRYENTQARLRDENALLRMRNQDLQRDVNTLDDLRVEGDADVEQLSEAIKQMELELVKKDQHIDELVAEMRGQEEESNTFRQELKDIGDSLNQVMDDRENTQATIESMQKDLINANAELEHMERNLRETKANKEVIEVQQESSQSEISFLREEQEADKLKIGELESALKRAKSSYRDELAIMKDVDELGADAQRAREEVRRLKKTLLTKDAEALTSSQRLEELESKLQSALGNGNGANKSLLDKTSRIQQELEDAVHRLELANLSLSDKEDLIVERESLLEASKLEIQRLTNLVNTERKAHKAERTEFEQRTRANESSAHGADTRIQELERARTLYHKQLTSLEQSYVQQLHERNTLLLSLWNRLSTICGASWAKRQSITEDNNTIPTLDKIATDLPHFNDTLSLAIRHVDSVVTHFRSKLNKTEDEIWQDFQKLDQALQIRFKRLDQLEKLAHRNSAMSNGNGLSVEASILADLARVKEENGVLRREIKHLKQSSSFSLPGLMPPQEALAIVNNLSGVRSAVSSSDKNGPESKRSSAVLTASSHLQTTSSSSTEPFPVRDDANGNIVDTSSGLTARDVAQTNGTFRSPSALGSTSALGIGRSPYVRASSFSQQQQQQQQRNQLPVVDGLSQHAKQKSQSLSKELATIEVNERMSVDESRWVLRLEEMQKRLEREREGRLLDRDGARTRLLEERKEIEGLKKELARAKSRGGKSGRVHDDGVD